MAILMLNHQCEKLSHFSYLECEKITPYFSLPPPAYDTYIILIRQGEKMPCNVKNDFAVWKVSSYFFHIGIWENPIKSEPF